MGNWGISFVLILALIFFIFYHSQTKFKNKMLCFFIRPNRQKIEKWVPLYSTYVDFDRGRYGKGHYNCNPECITMMWFTRGINKFFPILVPTLEFKWNSPEPLDPKTFDPIFQSPEARNASWEEHQHIAFAKAAALASGKRSRFPEWFFPLIIIALALAILYLSYSGMTGLDERMFNLEQQLKLLY